MQSVIEDDAIRVGEGILQQKELRLHMLSKVPCCPAIRGPENTEGCLLCEDVQEELSVGRITLNKQNKLWGDAPLRGKRPVSWSMQHLLVIFGRHRLFPTRPCWTDHSSLHVNYCSKKNLWGSQSTVKPVDQLMERALLLRCNHRHTRRHQLLMLRHHSCGQRCALVRQSDQMRATILRVGPPLD